MLIGMPRDIPVMYETLFAYLPMNAIIFRFDH